MWWWWVTGLAELGELEAERLVETDRTPLGGTVVHHPSASHNALTNPTKLEILSSTASTQTPHNTRTAMDAMVQTWPWFFSIMSNTKDEDRIQSWSRHGASMGHMSVRTTFDTWQEGLQRPEVGDSVDLRCKAHTEVRTMEGVDLIVLSTNLHCLLDHDVRGLQQLLASDNSSVVDQKRHGSDLALHLIDMYQDTV